MYALFVCVGSVRELRAIYGDKNHAVYGTINQKKNASFSSKRSDSSSSSAAGGGGGTIHTLCTTNGSPYQSMFTIMILIMSLVLILYHHLSVYRLSNEDCVCNV
jgi:hypothetical protein